MSQLTLQKLARVSEGEPAHVCKLALQLLPPGELKGLRESTENLMQKGVAVEKFWPKFPYGTMHAVRRAATRCLRSMV